MTLIVLGSAALVLVTNLTILLQQNIESAISLNGRDDISIVLRRGAKSPIESIIPLSDVSLIEALPSLVSKEGSRNAASAETLIQATVRTSKGKPIDGAQLCGVSIDNLKAIRPYLHLVRGRVPIDGVSEAIVSTALQESIGEHLIGERLNIGGVNWRVVGVFEAPVATAMNIFADAKTVNTMYYHPFFQSVRLKISSPNTLARVADLLKMDPRLSSYEVQTTKQYYLTQAVAAGSSIRRLGLSISAIIGLGVLFAALNTTYTATDARRHDFLIIRAIGFHPWVITAGAVLEIWLLAIIGALLAIIFVKLFIDGKVLSVSWFMPIHMNIRLHFILPSISTSMAWASLVGIIGGWFPIRSVCALPLSHGLRSEL